MAEGTKSEPLAIYESRPPEWLPKAHVSADLGYAGFHPPRPHQVEETLTESNVKNGLIIGSFVPAETYSASDHARRQITQGEALNELEELMNLIFTRKAENVPAIPASSFRLPSRVTLNDAKRNAWFADLANPDVPLSKLGKNVPHGAKGHDLLDLLHNNRVAIPRAVWFLRVFGANESAGLRNRPSYNPTQYSIEWANVMTSYMKKQLGEIALPSAPRPGLNVKQTFKGVLSDEEPRNNWVSRFTYCLSLLRTFYAEGLVDNRTFLAWLVHQMSTCNLAQAGFVVRLADEYLDGMLISRALTHPFLEACLSKFAEIHSASAKDQLINTTNILRNLVSRSFLALPDAAISPRMYIQYGTILEEILLDNFVTEGSDYASNQNIQNLQQTVMDTLYDVQHRNEAMLFEHLPPRVLGTLSSALSDIKLLNSISGKTDMSSISLFDDTSETSETFSSRLDFLLTWSVTPLQYGDHRPYAAACLLHIWRNKAEERAIRRDAPSPDEHIQSLLFHWLNSSDVAGDPSNLPAVALLYGQLVKHGLFSYEDYMQHLIARGEEGLSYTMPADTVSRHREFLRWIPIHEPSPALLNQRKAILYGLRMRETPEEANEKEIRKELRALLPEIFGGESPPGEILTTTFWQSCSHLLSSPRFEQVKTIKQWFLPMYKKFLSGHRESSVETDGVILRVFTLIVIIIARVRGYGSILDISLYTLEYVNSSSLLMSVIETLRQHMEVWACMNRMKEVASALWNVHQTWRSRGSQNRVLLKLLAEVDNDCYLEPSAREQMLSDISAYTHALFPTNENPDTVPPVLPEILLLAADPAPEAPSVLANSLWYKYMTSSDWAWKVWDNTIASLRQIPSMIPDIPGRRVCALRYAVFLLHVDQHLPRGFDEQIRSWLLGSGRNEIAALTTEAWEVVAVVLLYLACYGALATTTILESLVFQVWQAGANVSSEEQGLQIEPLLTAVNSLFEHLLLKDECGTGMPPVDVFEAQGLQTRRRDVFREPHFSLLVANFPAIVLIEQNRFLPEALRMASMALRQAICRVNVFRQGVYRDLDAVRLTFEKLLESQQISEDLHNPLVEALRLMLSDPQDGPVNAAEWRSVPSVLSHWKLAATSIQIRLTIKQLQEGMFRESTRKVACASLDNLTSTVFNACKKAEEADFIADLVTGVDKSVAAKFVNAGIRRIIDIFRVREWDLLKDDPIHNDLKRCASETLRLLANIVAPFRKDASLPQLDEPTQEAFYFVLCEKIAHIADKMATLVQQPWSAEASRCSQSAIFLARMLQFHLGFPLTWSQKAKDLAEDLCHNLTRLALMHGAGEGLNMLAFPLLLDTLCYTLDEIPADMKATATASFDPFRNYPEFNLSDLPSDMPPEYKARMRTLLPYVELNPTVEDLVYTTRDANGTLLSTVPVQNRPWEWTEYLGENPPGEPARGDDRSLEDRPHVKNSAALSLDLFDARVTGDRIIPPLSHPAAATSGTAGTEIEDMMAEANLRSFQDDVYAEGPFRRDWRETRIMVKEAASGAHAKTEQEESVPPLLAFSGHAHGHGHSTSGMVAMDHHRASSRRPSPASSVRSAGTGPVGSVRPSPAHPHSRLSVSTTGEIIDVDAFDAVTSASGSTNKRKAMDTITEEDDDIEIVEGPVPASSRTQKRPKAKAASKTTKGKRR